MANSRRRPLPSSSAYLVVRHRRHLSSSAMPNDDLGHRPVHHSAVSAGPYCPLNTPSSLPGADVWSPENLHHQPVGNLFRSWLALSLTRQGSLVTIVHTCIAALHSLQINCATMKWLPSAGRTQTWPWALSTCLIFPPKTAQDHLQHDMVANFWTAPTAWFQGKTGPNLADSPCPSVTSYWCSAEGYYLTIFEHRTPWKTTLKPSASNHNFLGNSSWGAWQSRWCLNSITNLVNFLQYGFLRKRVRSLDLPPSLAASP